MINEGIGLNENCQNNLSLVDFTTFIAEVVAKLEWKILWNFQDGPGRKCVFSMYLNMCTWGDRKVMRKVLCTLYLPVKFIQICTMSNTTFHEYIHIAIWHLKCMDRILWLIMFSYFVGGGTLSNMHIWVVHKSIDQSYSWCLHW